MFTVENGTQHKDKYVAHNSSAQTSQILWMDQAYLQNDTNIHSKSGHMLELWQQAMQWNF